MKRKPVKIRPGKNARKKRKVITLSPQMTRHILAVIRSADFVSELRSYL